MPDKRYFGTDGVRAVANIHPMTAEFAVNLGRALVCTLGTSGTNGKKPRFIVCRDTRISGDMLESGLCAGLCSMGGDALVAGVLPTPAAAALVRETGAAAGVVISASHNPFEDNGIKIFRADGTKLTDDEERRLEVGLDGGALRRAAESVRDMGRRIEMANAGDRYLDFLIAAAGKSETRALSGMSVVLDAANGACFDCAPRLMKRLGVRAEALFVEPDGRNINLHCGSQHPEALADRVRETGADMGLAFDGDGDRLVAVDETGRIITGDRILAICARRLKSQNALPGNRVVTTVMRNIGLKIALKKMGVAHSVTDVGDRYVAAEMRATGAVLGGEDSGHMIFMDRHTTGDGLLTALMLMSAVRESGGTLSEAASIMSVFPQKLMNLEVREKPEIHDLPGVTAAIRKAEAELGENGRVLVRYSGTQPLCRVMVEGPTGEVTERLCREILDAAAREIGSEH